MRKLWNRPSLPVWSLVTLDAEGKANMNICTYVTSISMQPKLMLVAVYKETKTLQNIEQNKNVLLQLLTENLAPIVRICGQMSGFSVDKIARLSKRYELGTHSGLPYFKESAGYMELEFLSIVKIEGDHVLALAKVLQAKNLNDQPILTTDYLKHNKIIR